MSLHGHPAASLIGAKKKLLEENFCPPQKGLQIRGNLPVLSAPTRNSSTNGTRKKYKHAISKYVEDEELSVYIVIDIDIADRKTKSL